MLNDNIATDRGVPPTILLLNINGVTDMIPTKMAFINGKFMVTTHIKWSYMPTYN